MNYGFVSRLVTAAAAALSLVGCGSFGERMWVPQGPGERVSTGSREPASAPPPRPRPSAVGPGPAQPAPTAGAETLAASGGYTQATRYGDLLFVSGQIALDPATNAFNEAANIEQQTRAVMENIQRILEGQRLTMANVVSVTVYLKNLNDFRGMDSVYESFFRSHLPARSVVEVHRLPRNALVEISLIAGR